MAHPRVTGATVLLPFQAEQQCMVWTDGICLPIGGLLLFLGYCVPSILHLSEEIKILVCLQTPHFSSKERQSFSLR